MTPSPVRVGVIADTHGYLDPQIEHLYAGVDLILHAGDVGDRQILHQLSAWAPTIAVRGNIDDGDLADLPESVQVVAGGLGIYMTHILSPPGERTASPVPPGNQIVLFGHSHQPVRLWHDGSATPVLYFNPASAGKQRFRNPRLTGMLTIHNGQAQAEHLPLT